MLLECNKNILEWMTKEVEEGKRHDANLLEEKYWSEEGIQQRYKSPIDTSKEDMHLLGTRLQNLKCYVGNIRGNSTGTKSLKKRTVSGC